MAGDISILTNSISFAILMKVIILIFLMFPSHQAPSVRKIIDQLHAPITYGYNTMKIVRKTSTMFSISCCEDEFNLNILNVNDVM